MKNCPGKAPVLNMYVKDWLTDIKLMATAHSTQGLWIKLLFYMWTDNQNHEINLSRDDFHRIGASDPEINQFIADAKNYKFCDIQVDNTGFVRVLSRRFQRENKQRDKWREQKQKQRQPKTDKTDKKPPVPPVSDESPSVSPSPSPSPRKNKEKESAPPAAPTPEKIGESIKHIVNQKTNRHFENHVGDFFTSIKQQCILIENKNGSKKKINPYQWIQVQVNNKAHPQAIDEALKGLNKYWDTTDNPWGYIEKIYKTLKQKFNEQEAIAYHEAMKKQNAVISKILGVNLFKEV